MASPVRYKEMLKDAGVYGKTKINASLTNKGEAASPARGTFEKADGAGGAGK